MKITIYAVAAIALFVAAPALAGERVTLNLTATDLQVLQLGLNALDGYHKVIKNTQGQEQDVLVAYDVAGATRLAIAHDEFAIQAVFADYRQAKSGVTDMTKVQEILDTKRPIELDLIDAAALKLDINPIPASVLASVGVVCPSCVGSTAAK